MAALTSSMVWIKKFLPESKSVSVYICTYALFFREFWILAELFDFLQFFSGNGQHLNYPSQTSDLTKLVSGEQITTLILSSQIADQNSYLLLRLEWYDSDIKDSKPDGVFHDNFILILIWYECTKNITRQKGRSVFLSINYLASF